MDFEVPPQPGAVRLDQFLVGELPALSRSRIQALVRGGHVMVNGRPAKPGEKLRGGDSVRFEEPPPVPTATQAEDIPLDILYEDRDLLVLNKPEGMVVHPAAGNAEHTLVNALLHHCGSLSVIGGEERPGIVHRLDKDTSGCMVVARNDQTHRELSAQFSGRTVEKIYLAMTAGLFRVKAGTIDAVIGRHPIHRKKMTVLTDGRGRHAVTDYRVLQEIEGTSLVECTLHTGRTHQIRVHLKHLGHPLLGDPIYGPKYPSPRLMLHAWKLGFTHPATGERLRFEAPVPREFPCLT